MRRHNPSDPKPQAAPSPFLSQAVQAIQGKTPEEVPEEDWG